MPPTKRPHPLATSTVASPSARRTRPRPSYANESDTDSDDGGDDASSDDGEQQQRRRPPAAAQEAESEDVLLLGSSSPLTLAGRQSSPDQDEEEVKVAAPRPTKPAAARRRSLPAAASTTAPRAGAGPRPSLPSSTSSASSAPPAVPRAPSTTASSPRTPSLAALPLPLVSHLLQQLLAPAPSGTSAHGTTALPQLEAAWSLVRHALAANGSTLSPREEVELRRVDGWVGGRVLRERSAGEGGLLPAHVEEGRELERSLGKAVGLCHKHTHLAQTYLPYLSVLQASLSALLDSPKLALKRLAKALALPALQSPAAQYRLSLAVASLQLEQGKPRLALSTLGGLRQRARERGDRAVACAVGVARVGVCARAGWWVECLALGAELEGELATSGSPTPKQEPSADRTASATPATASTDTFPPALASQLRAHLLILRILALNHVGSGADCAARVKELHALLDAEGEAGAGGGMAGLGGGVLEIPFAPCPTDPSTASLLLAFTRPQTLYVLACLVTALAKRDPTGKRPKKRLFADEGLRQLGQGDVGSFPPGATQAADVCVLEHQRALLKAELLCETAGVAVVRSEFGTASQILAKLVAHTRQHGLFASFAAQITLLQAYLAHSTAQSAAALDLYRAAAHLALVSSAPAPHPGGPERAELAKAARLGEAGLLVGLGRAGEVGKDVRALAKDVWGASGAASTGGEARRDENVGLRIAGGLVLGVLQDEILRSKQFMKSCLDLSSGAADNSSKPIILSLTAALFVNTREKQSVVMLETALQMARSLGPDGAGGNAALGAWLGEKYEAVKRKNAELDKADTMAKRNDAHRARLQQIRQKAGGGAYQPWVVGGEGAGGRAPMEP